jgi:phosphate transport system protein
MSDNNRIYSQHISKQFNDELEQLRNDFSKMGEMVASQTRDAVTALREQNQELAQAVIDLDRQTNEFERRIDQDCTQIIALRQPAAIDLRLIISISRAVSDLERIGDEASRVAKQAIDLIAADSGTKGISEIRHTGELVVEMLNLALEAFSNGDTELAYKVVKFDQHVDQEYQSAMRSLITFMMEDSRAITNVLKAIWVLRSLERIGDHACNLAEQLIYQVSGTDVRHMDNQEIREIVRD